MWEACEALKDALLILGPGIDGGKDSLSMAAKVIKLYCILLYCIIINLSHFILFQFNIVRFNSIQFNSMEFFQKYCTVSI